MTADFPGLVQELQ